MEFPRDIRGVEDSAPHSSECLDILEPLDTPGLQRASHSPGANWVEELTSLGSQNHTSKLGLRRASMVSGDSRY